MQLAALQGCVQLAWLQRAVVQQMSRFSASRPSAERACIAWNARAPHIMTQQACHRRVQLLAVLGSIQLALAAERIAAAEALLPQADALLAALEEAPPATVPDAAENAAGRPALAVGRAALRLQHRVLRVCVLLAAGRTGPLALQKPGAACIRVRL